MRTSTRFPTRLAALALVSLAALVPAAQAADKKPADDNAQQQAEQVIVPQVERRDLDLPRYPSNDIEFGLYLGGMNVQNFGSSATAGGRLGYHLTEDWFVEANYGQVRVGDQAFRRILPGGVLNRAYERLQTYDLDVGYNVWNGEAFFGTNTAKLTSVYATGGIGNTVFDGQRMQTWVYGFGTELFLNKWFAVRADARNHLYHLDLLGKRELNQTYELNVGVSVLF
ncbi:MAG TPA: outer membrane beta-barrel domain-containing protein [Burkholderiaceae bacterium]